MHTSRIRALSIFVFLFASVLAGRLFFVQVIYGKDYSDSADRQYVTPTSNMFSRGSIYFQEKNGNPVSAATLKTGFTVAINPKVLVDAEKTFKALNVIILIDRDSFFLQSEKKDD